MVMKKNCFEKEKTEKKKAETQRRGVGQTPKGTRNKRWVLCVRAVFMPNLLVVRGQAATFAFSFSRFAF
jgi:hypothetical protein